MTAEDTYSNSDSNHNRKLEQRIDMRYAAYFGIFLVIFFSVIYFYSKNIHQADISINTIKTPTAESPPANNFKSADEAKEYDPTVAPYEQ
jgi:hypothetical protein